MAYNYGMQGAPVVGNGLGGLPRRVAATGQPSSSVRDYLLWSGGIYKASHAWNRIFKNGMAKLSSTKAVVVTADNTNARFQGYVLTLDKNSVTSGVTQTVVSGASSPGSAVVVALNETTAVAAFLDGSVIKSCVLTISGDTITAGSVTTVVGSDCNYPALAVLSETSVLLAYTSPSSQVARAMVLTISGTSVSANSPTAFGSATTFYYPTLCVVDSTKVICALTTSASGQQAVVLSISGATVTAGSIATVNASSGGGYLSIGKLSSTLFIAAGIDGSTQAYTCLLTLSGTSISAGSITSYPAMGMIFSQLSLVVLSPATAFIFSANNSTFNGFTVEISGTTMTGKGLASTVADSTYSLTEVAVALMDDKRVLLLSGNTNGTYAKAATQFYVT